MGTPLQPLDIIKEILISIGLEITKELDDLVFIENNFILLRVGKSGEDVLLYFHPDSSAERRADMTNLLKECGRQYRFAVDKKGTFTVTKDLCRTDVQLRLFEGCL